MTDKLIIFDTTLRDGEQSPGASMTREEKLRIARQLEKLGVDVIEAGFAAASPGDADAIKSIAQVVEAFHGVFAGARQRARRARGGRGDQAGQITGASTPSSPPRPSTWKRSCA